MAIETRSFKTKVARRIFLLFVVCALVPISVLALVSYWHVRHQLLDQSRQRLQQESIAIATSVYERLVFLRTEMHLLASGPPGRLQLSKLPDQSPTDLGLRFKGLALVKANETAQIWGQAVPLPLLSADQRQHMADGNALLVVSDRSGESQILMGIERVSGPNGAEFLFGLINRAYLWEAAERRPPFTELQLMGQSGQVLFNSLSRSTPLPFQLPDDYGNYRNGHFDWHFQGQTFFASFTRLYLKPNFHFPEWIVILSEPINQITAPMVDFKLSFPAALIVSLALVFLLSIGLIKKMSGPIEILEEATHHIAESRFGHKVAIHSGDEFETLGNAFNQMSAKLEESQALLVRTAKMATMGQMAAGILHEIKQPLTAIYAHIELAKLCANSPQDSNRLDLIMESTGRINDILTRFSMFAYMGGEKMSPLDIDQVVDKVARLMEHQFQMKSIRFAIDNPGGLPRITGDMSGLQQVFSNLFLNSIHALEDRPREQRTLRVRYYPCNHQLCVDVQDNGCGIATDIQARVFDPFFTTKEAGKGTGLGMAIVASILHRHAATISFTSQVGTGTTFTIAFPIKAEGRP